MSALAVMLVAMGIADACRRLTRFLWIPVMFAPIAVVGTARRSPGCGTSATLRRC